MDFQRIDILGRLIFTRTAPIQAESGIDVANKIREYSGEVLVKPARFVCCRRWPTAISRDWMGQLASCLKFKVSVSASVAESPWLPVLA
jgi:hypothetical protein